MFLCLRLRKMLGRYQLVFNRKWSSIFLSSILEDPTKGPGYSLCPQGVCHQWRALAHLCHLKVLSYGKGTVNYLTNTGSFCFNHVSFPCSIHVTCLVAPLTKYLRTFICSFGDFSTTQIVLDDSRKLFLDGKKWKAPDIQGMKET